MKRLFALALVAALVAFPAAAQTLTGIQIQNLPAAVLPPNATDLLILNQQTQINPPLYKSRKITVGQLGTVPPGVPGQIPVYTTAGNSLTLLGPFGGGLPLITDPASGLAPASKQGTTNTFAATNGVFVNGNCRTTDSLGNEIDAGVTCGAGSGGVTSGLARQFTIYQSAGTTVVGTFGPTMYELWANPNGDDANPGTSPTFPKATLSAAEAALASTGGTIHATGGAFTLTSTLALQPNVVIDCSAATITQANGNGLSELIGWETNTANGAGLRNCTIDGNQQNQTNTCSGTMLNVGPANDAYLDNNVIKNAVCDAIEITTGLRPQVTNNSFDSFRFAGIDVEPGVANTQTHGVYTGNWFTTIGAHAALFAGSDYNIFQNNHVIGAVTTGIVATISAANPATATWVSGANFSSLHSGQFLICNGTAGYQELYIAKVNSSTSITFSTAATAAGASQNCSGGAGDLVDLDGSFNSITDNTMSGTATAGVVINNFNIFETVTGNIVSLNGITNAGFGCIVSEGILNGGAIMVGNSAQGNSLFDCDLNSAASFSQASAGAIVVLNDSTTTTVDFFVDGNHVTDALGASQTKGWMSIIGTVAQGEVAVGKNTWRGTALGGIVNGIRSVQLSAGFGSGASVSSWSSNGSSYSVILVASGTTGGLPSITVNKSAYGSEVPPQPVCNLSASNGSSNTVTVSVTNISQDVFVFNGTPTSGVTYTLWCK